MGKKNEKEQEKESNELRTLRNENRSLRFENKEQQTKFNSVIDDQRKLIASLELELKNKSNKINEGSVQEVISEPIVTEKVMLNNIGKDNNGIKKNEVGTQSPKPTTTKEKTNKDSKKTYAETTKSMPNANLPSKMKQSKKVKNDKKKALSYGIKESKQVVEKQKYYKYEIFFKVPKIYKETRGESSRLAKIFLIEVGLYKYVVVHSMNGNSIIEIYVMQKDKGVVENILEFKKVNVITVNRKVYPKFMEKNFKDKIVNRTAHLLSRFYTKNLRKVILEGFDESLQSQILEKEIVIRNNYKNFKEGKKVAAETTNVVAKTTWRAYLTRW